MVVISVGVPTSTGVNLGIVTRGVNGSMSNSSCFVSTGELRLEPTEARTGVGSGDMVVSVGLRGLSGAGDILKSVE